MSTGMSMLPQVLKVTPFYGTYLLYIFHSHHLYVAGILHSDTQTKWQFWDTVTQKQYPGIFD